MGKNLSAYVSDWLYHFCKLYNKQQKWNRDLIVKPWSETRLQKTNLSNNINQFAEWHRFSIFACNTLQSCHRSIRHSSSNVKPRTFWQPLTTTQKRCILTGAPLGICIFPILHDLKTSVHYICDDMWKRLTFWHQHWETKRYSTTSVNEMSTNKRALMSAVDRM